ncbi:MAG: CDP-diacylglycerol--glycerol-3-phosphate 3-phosphatidyltransferase [Treponema sp.]|nr:CDP-diacylglycerol--glycerol-3-phosphate 3-phosphatidyltransferase [Treponema sp.]
MKTSNKFTITRIIFAPIFFIIYFIPIWTGWGSKLSLLIALPLLAFAEFTDFLDGHYARKHNEVSDFGKIFDPFADVILHMTTFACLMFSADASIGSYTPRFVFILIMYREMSQTFLRMVAAKQGIAIAARKGGKVKTVTYVVSGFYALFLEALVRFDYIPECFGALKIVAVCLFVLSLILSYASFLDYIVHFGKVIKVN